MNNHVEGQQTNAYHAIVTTLNYRTVKPGQLSTNHHAKYAILQKRNNKEPAVGESKYKELKLEERMWPIPP